MLSKKNESLRKHQQQNKAPATYTLHKGNP